MSVKQAWINLPVKDMNRAKAFYKAIGFRPNASHEFSEDTGSFFIGDKDFVMMLFTEATFSRIAHHPLSDTDKGAEMLMNIDAESREEVDAMAATVRAAGGRVFAEPAEADGWMYVTGFTDPDGHRWAMLYMDWSKMPSVQ